MEPISYSEAMGFVEETLKERLERARIFPELIYQCNPPFKALKTLETLQKNGCKLFLSTGLPEISFGDRFALDENALKIYRKCRLISPNNWLAYRGREVYLGVWGWEVSKVGNKYLIAYLGEWRPFIEFQGDPLKLNWAEFRKLLKPIRLYARRLGMRFTLPHDKITDSDEVVLIRSAEPPKFAKYLCNLSNFTEYNRAYVLSEIDKLMERERRLRNAFETVVKNSVFEDGLIKVNPSELERVFEFPSGSITNVAKEVIIIMRDDVVGENALTRGNLVMTSAIAEAPTEHLHAMKYLMSRGFKNLCLATTKTKSGKWVVGIEIMSGAGFVTIVVPKAREQLPPIPLAKVVMKKKGLALVTA
jgi:hypothetical protein